MRSAGPGMNVLRCDAEGCDAKFYSASMISKIRAQAAEIEGWRRERKLDLCPNHWSWKPEDGQDKRAADSVRAERRTA